MEVDVGVDLKYDSGPPSDDDLVDIDVKDDGDVKIDTLLAAGGDISHDVGDGIMKDILNDATFDLVRAEAAYRQVLDVDSSHMHTLYAFGNCFLPRATIGRRPRPSRPQRRDQIRRKSG